MPIARTVLPLIIRVVVNQRLVPRLCPVCRRAHVLSDHEREVLVGNSCTTTLFFRSDGCPRCNDTGISGRAVVPDAIFFPDNALAREHLSRLASTNDLQRANEVEGAFHYTRTDAINSLLSSGQISAATAVDHLSD